MHAGDLRDVVVFQQKTVTGTGESYTVTWSDDFEERVNAERFSETSCRFIIRYRTDIAKTTHRIIWDGSIWTITNLIHDRKRTMLTIESDITELVEATDLDSETTEYVDGVPVLRPPSS